MHDASPRRYRILLLLFAVAIVALVAAILWQLGSPSSSPVREKDFFLPETAGAPLSRERFARLSSEASLDAKIQSLRSELDSIRGNQEEDSPPRSLEENREPHVGRSEEGSSVLRAQEEAKVFSQIGEAFSSQPVDQAWSTSMTRRLHDQVRAQPLDQATLDKVECRSSACRIEINASDSADLGAIRDSLRTPIADVLGTGASKRDEHGKYVLYLGKDPVSLGLAAKTR